MYKAVTAALATRVVAETAGIVTYEGGGFSSSELNAASEMARRGNNVALRAADPTAARTSDLLVNGTPYDVYTPTTGNIDRIVSRVASKGSQVRGGGVVIDLS